MGGGGGDVFGMLQCNYSQNANKAHYLDDVSDHSYSYMFNSVL